MLYGSGQQWPFRSPHIIHRKRRPISSSGVSMGTDEAALNRFGAM